MTRLQPANGRSGTRRATATVSPRIGTAPLLSLAGLVVAAIVTLAVLLASPGSSTPANGGTGAQPIATSSPNAPPASAPERVAVKGTILVVKGGNIWAISGTDPPRRVSTSGNLSSPAWSPDGATLYAIERRTTRARAPFQGRDVRYTLQYPLVVRIRADGSAVRIIHNGLYQLGGDERRRWFTWLLQPDVSPDGRTIALISDGPDAFRRDPTMSLLPAAGGRITNLNLPEQSPLGHGDPAWSPDGKLIAYTDNLGERGQGEPRIGIYTVRTRTTRDLTRRGYAQPSWSPDGRYLAAVRTDGRGRDVVVLDARNGSEVARLTRDGESFAPTWSPDGTQVAYLKVTDQGVDLRLLTFASGALQVTSDKPVTADRQLDATSQPAWFIPADERG